jgi:hypothetical protein
MNQKIFISIASYRDRLLKNTILEAYNKAKFRNNLVFGVFEQNNIEDSLNLDDFRFKDQIRYSRVDYQESKGVCWARKHVQDMYQDEEYYFQIDAHSLFDQNWDEYFINRLEEIRKYHAKPIITAYPHDFEHTTLRPKVNYQPNELLIIWTGEERNPLFKTMGFCPPWGGFRTSPHMAVHGFYLGACCIFTIGNFVRDVPYDDAIFFGGEEPMLALRAWTHGYNIFHTTNLHLYHCWQKSYGGVVHWDIDSSQKQQHEAHAIEHINKLVNNQVPAPYGLGTERTAEQYMSYSGVNYRSQEYKHHPEMFTVPYYEKLPLV